MSHPFLRQILLETTRELFTAYGVSNEIVAAPVMDDQTVCGILGFTGATICGSVMIAASREAVAATNPIEGGQVTHWLAELTNQIVGRFKNSLVRRGADIWLSLPVVLSATRLVPVPQGPVDPVHMRVGGAPFTLWLETEGTIALEAPDEDACPREGEAFLF
ncbi:MAG: chemotaxis protein CheX [Kofleriaceae bacterium]